jgi:hypothetical protein
MTSVSMALPTVISDMETARQVPTRSVGMHVRKLKAC